MPLTFQTPTSRTPGKTLRIEPEAVIIAGFTGRDTAAVLEHLEELRDLGVPAPSSVPSYYQALGSAAVQRPVLQVLGAETSGEAEAVLLLDGDTSFLTLGSDHTDRAAEAFDIGLAKVVCQKPVAAFAWPFNEVAAHLDELELRSWITEDNNEALYQEGTLGELRPLGELIEAVPFNKRPDRFALFTGTVSAIGGIRPGSRFRASLVDPVLERSISLSYEIEALNALK